MNKILPVLFVFFIVFLILTACDKTSTDISTPETEISENVSETSEASEPEESTPEESAPAGNTSDESYGEESTASEKYVWYGGQELKAWFAELKQSIDSYEPRDEITDDGMRTDHFTTIQGFFIDYLDKYEEKVFDYDYVPKFGATGDANIAALAEYYGISKEEYIQFCKEYLAKWGKAPYGEKPYGLEIYMLNWDAWFSEEYWKHPDFVFSDYDSERYDCYYTSVPDRGDYTRRYYRIDYELIQYVGEENFQKWLDEKEDKDQNILDFIEYFEITREQYDKLYKDYFPIPYNPDYLFGTPEMQDEYFKVHPLN